ncbi:MAG: hypothetical protein KJO40_13420 [Deltaproteobacteria bacterium]|nr:hypothetical protein [Deltaproteobacteria bacterium]
MSNISVDLPFPVANGAGTPVDVSAMGANKTIVCGGTFKGASVTVQASVDGGSTWGPVHTFAGQGDKKILDLAAEFMRVVVRGRKTAVPFSANCDVGSSDDGSTFASLPLPALNGPGAAVDISGMGVLSTIIAGGDFGGASLTVEISQDDVDYAPCGVSFTGSGGLATQEVSANWARVNVQGRRSSVPFTATIAMGSANDASGGGASAIVAYGEIYADDNGVGQGPLAIGSWTKLITPSSDGLQTAPGVVNDAANQQILVEQSGVYEVEYNASVEVVQSNTGGSIRFGVQVDGAPAAPNVQTYLPTTGGGNPARDIGIAGLLNLPGGGNVVDVAALQGGSTDHGILIRYYNLHLHRIGDVQT